MGWKRRVREKREREREWTNLHVNVLTWNNINISILIMVNRKFGGIGCEVPFHFYLL